MKWGAVMLRLESLENREVPADLGPWGVLIEPGAAVAAGAIYAPAPPAGLFEPWTPANEAYWAVVRPHPVLRPRPVWDGPVLVWPAPVRNPGPPPVGFGNPVLE